MTREFTVDPLDLAKLIKMRQGKTETERSLKGRKLFVPNIKKVPSINIIPYYSREKVKNNHPSNNINIIPQYEILRPNLQFLSNARPAMLQWREKKIKKTPIITYMAYNQYQPSKVPIHRGYSRKYVNPSEYSLDKSLSKKLSKLPSSSLTWLSPHSLTGLPTAITTLSFPTRSRPVNTGTK